MTFGPDPIAADAALRGLTADQHAAANQHDASIKRAALDEAELHDLERAEYYGEAPAALNPEALPKAAHRSLLDRLFRRRRG